MIQQIEKFNFAIIEKGVGAALEISLIKGFDDNFDMHDWKNRSQARQLINNAKSMLYVTAGVAKKISATGN